MEEMLPLVKGLNPGRSAKSKNTFEKYLLSSSRTV
jgi:hypothetical protein